MEFNIKRETFLNGVQRTLGIVDKKTTLAILNNVLIKADRNKIRMTASDREISLVADYEAEIIEEGEITLSARKLYEMIREMQGDDVHVSVNENHLARVSCLKSHYRISGIPTDDYPVVEELQEGEFSAMTGKALKELIHKTSFAMASDEIRKNLNGVFFETEKVDSKYHVRMVATDGHRLAMAYVETDETDFFNLEKGIIIPRKGLGEVRKFVEGEDENSKIFIGVYKGMFVVKTDRSILKVRLVDGEYPEYQRVIPTEAGLIVHFDKEVMLHALKRMNVMSTDRYNNVVFNITKDKIVLNSTNPDLGEANDEIDIVYHDKDVTMAFNVLYVIDAIEVIEGKDVFFEIGSDRKPCVVKPVGNDRYLCIIMPLQI
jgi:DNA polymerase-3 subunit beta